MTEENREKQAVKKKPHQKAGPGRPKGSKKTQPVKTMTTEISLTELDRVDHAMLRLEADEPVISNVEIEKRLGIPRRQASKRRKRDIYQRALIELHKSYLQVLRDGKVRAARKLVSLIDDRDPGIALGASKALLKSDLAQTINLNVQGGKLDEIIDSMPLEDLRKFVDTGVMSIDDDRNNEQ